MAKCERVNIDVYSGDPYEPFYESELTKISFPVFRLINEPYDYLVIKTSCYVSSADTYKIANELNIKQAKILYDSFLTNQNHYNRYLLCDYDSEKSYLSSWAIVNEEEIDGKIKNISRDFFCENADIIDKSCLPNALKYLAKSRMI